jgi:hypothetical protein
MRNSTTAVDPDTSASNLLQERVAAADVFYATDLFLKFFPTINDFVSSG